MSPLRRPFDELRLRVLAEFSFFFVYRPDCLQAIISGRRCSRHCWIELSDTVGSGGLKCLRSKAFPTRTRATSRPWNKPHASIGWKHRRMSRKRSKTRRGDDLFNSLIPSPVRCEGSWLLVSSTFGRISRAGRRNYASEVKALGR